MKLELWINEQDKIISFQEISEWLHQVFESEESIHRQLERFIALGFRFQ